MLRLKLKPLYSLSENVNDDIFNHVEFDELSKQLINLGENDQRYPVVGWILLDENKISQIESRTRPGLPTTANEKDIKRARKIFGNNFVIAKDVIAGAGIVHVQTIEQIEEKEPKLKNSRKKYIGLSMTKKHNGSLIWLNRSAQNINTFERDELALACLTFEPEMKSLTLSEYTLEYHLNRSIPEKIFKQFVTSAEKNLNKKCTANDDSNYSIKYEHFWNDILALNDEKQQEKLITELVMTNMYIASSLPIDSKRLPKGYNQNDRNGYELILIKLLETTKKYKINIRAHIDFVPDKFKKETKNSSSLIMAAKQGYTRIVTLLINANASINLTDENGTTALFIATEKNNIEMVNLLLEAKANVNQAIKNHFTPLQMATQNNHITIAKLLLDAKAEIDQANINGVTPLFVAADNGHKEMIKLLLNANANVNQADNTKVTPLFIATAKNHVEIIELLLNHKANVNLTEKNDYSPLLLAAQNNHMKNVELFLEAKADVNSETSVGLTPLAMAVGNGGSIEIVKLLLDANATVNSIEKSGFTPLLYAITNNRVEITKLLLETKADVNKARIDNGATSLSAAAKSGHIEVVKFLLELKADVNSVEKNGCTPLMKVVARIEDDHFIIAELLLDAKANVNQARTDDGATPLSIAAQKYNAARTVKLLLDAKADIDKARTDNGATPLLSAIDHIIMEFVQLRTVKLLIKSKANVDRARTSDGATPLSIAIEKGYKQIIKLLVDAKANVNSTTKDGDTLALLAAQKHQFEIAKLLLDTQALSETKNSLLEKKSLFAEMKTTQNDDPEYWLLKKRLNQMNKTIYLKSSTKARKESEKQFYKHIIDVYESLNGKVSIRTCLSIVRANDKNMDNSYSSMILDDEMFADITNKVKKNRT